MQIVSGWKVVDFGDGEGHAEDNVWVASPGYQKLLSSPEQVPPEPTALVTIDAFFVPGYTLKSFLDWALSSFRSDVYSYQELSRKQFMLSGGLPAYSVVTKWGAETGPQSRRWLHVITVKGGRGFWVQARVSDSGWGALGAQLEKMVYSLAVAD